MPHSMAGVMPQAQWVSFSLSFSFFSFFFFFSHIEGACTCRRKGIGGLMENLTSISNDGGASQNY